MICSHCGATVNEGAAFCQNCGQPTGEPAQPQYEQPAQPQYEQPAQPQAQQGQYQQGQYQNQYQQPYQNPYQQQGSPVKSGAYLAWSIIVTALCCWPLGIPAIVFAARINSCNDRGDFIGAQAAARKSKTWTIVAACVGFALILIGVLTGVLAGLSGALSELSY